MAGVDSINWINIPKPIIESISYLLQSDKKTRAFMREVRDSLKASKKAQEKPNFTRKLEESPPPPPRPAAKEEQNSVIDYFKTSIEDIRVEVSRVIGKQGKKLEDQTTSLKKDIVGLNTQVEIGLSDNEKRMMNYIDSRIKHFDKRLSESEQKIIVNFKTHDQCIRSMEREVIDIGNNLDLLKDTIASNNKSFLHREDFNHELDKYWDKLHALQNEIEDKADLVSSMNKNSEKIDLSLNNLARNYKQFKTDIVLKYQYLSNICKDLSEKKIEVDKTIKHLEHSQGQDQKTFSNKIHVQSVIMEELRASIPTRINLEIQKQLETIPKEVPPLAESGDAQFFSLDFRLKTEEKTRIAEINRLEKLIQQKDSRKFKVPLNDYLKSEKDRLPLVMNLEESSPRLKVRTPRNYRTISHNRSTSKSSMNLSK